VPVLSPYATQFFSDLLHSTLAMSESGIPYHLPSLSGLRDQSLATIDTIEQASPDYPFRGPGSGLALTSLSKQLADTLDLPLDLLEVTREKKIISSGKQNRALFLSALPPGSHHHNLLTAINRHRQAGDLISDHLNPLTRFLVPLPRPNPYIKVVYPSWFITPSPFKDGAGDEGGTEQGRITCSSPPEQTKPKLVKECRTSRYPGGHIITYDFAQIELRVAALISHDPYLCEAYGPSGGDRDLHTELAQFVEGMAVTDTHNFHSGDNRTDRRQWYKQARFLSLYRGGPDILRRTLIKVGGPILSAPRAQEIIEGCRNQCSGLWEWQDRAIALAASEGFVSIPLTGHRRHTSPEDPQFERIVCNFPVQCIAALTNLRLQSYLAPRLPAHTHLILNTYDSLTFDTINPSALDTLYREGIHWLTEQDYWHMLQQQYQNEILLDYGTQ